MKGSQFQGLNVFMPKYFPIPAETSLIAFYIHCSLPVLLWAWRITQTSLSSLFSFALHPFPWWRTVSWWLQGTPFIQQFNTNCVNKGENKCQMQDSSFWNERPILRGCTSCLLGWGKGLMSPQELGGGVGVGAGKGQAPDSGGTTRGNRAGGESGCLWLWYCVRGIWGPCPLRINIFWWLYLLVYLFSWPGFFQFQHRR